MLVSGRVLTNQTLPNLKSYTPKTVTAKATEKVSFFFTPPKKVISLPTQTNFQGASSADSFLFNACALCARLFERGGTFFVPLYGHCWYKKPKPDQQDKKGTSWSWDRKLINKKPCSSSRWRMWTKNHFITFITRNMFFSIVSRFQVCAMLKHH